MSTLHCPLCGLWFRYGSELDGHVRDDHAPAPDLHLPPPRRRSEDGKPVAEHDPVLHLPW